MVKVGSVGFSFLLFCFFSDHAFAQVVHWPLGLGCHLKYGPQTNCVIEMNIEDGPEMICAGQLPGNQQANDGNYCGTFRSFIVSPNPPWKSVVAAETGFEGICWFKDCYRTGVCHVYFDANLGWMCGSDPEYELIHYFLDCDLDDKELQCATPGEAP